MRLLHILHDLLDDRSRESLVRAGQSHHGVALIGTGGLDKGVVELGLLVCELSHTATCQNGRVSVCTDALSGCKDLIVDILEKILQTELKILGVALAGRVCDSLSDRRLGFVHLIFVSECRHILLPPSVCRILRLCEIEKSFMLIACRRFRRGIA